MLEVKIEPGLNNPGVEATEGCEGCERCAPLAIGFAAAMNHDGGWDADDWDPTFLFTTTECSMEEALPSLPPLAEDVVVSDRDPGYAHHESHYLISSSAYLPPSETLELPQACLAVLPSYSSYSEPQAEPLDWNYNFKHLCTTSAYASSLQTSSFGDLHQITVPDIGSSLSISQPPIYESFHASAFKRWSGNSGKVSGQTFSAASSRVEGNSRSQQQQHSATRITIPRMSPLSGPPPSFSRFLHRSEAGGSGFLSPYSYGLPVQSFCTMPNNNVRSHLYDLNATSHMASPMMDEEMMFWLLKCAEALEAKHLDAADDLLAHLSLYVDMGGVNSQRFGAYFQQALSARLNNESHGRYGRAHLNIERSILEGEMLEALHVYSEKIPIDKFSQMTCNQILLEAIGAEKAIHVLDLDLQHGLQWPAFLQLLAKQEDPPKVRLSAVGCDSVAMNFVGERLHVCAQGLSILFEFCPILTPLETFSGEMVEKRQGEVLVVNSRVHFYRILNKEPNNLNKLLNDLRWLKPKVMAFAENDGSLNSDVFMDRFKECLRHYSAVFDSFDKSLPNETSVLMKVEQSFGVQNIVDIISCEGRARVHGLEKMTYWHNRMEAAHFQCIPLSYQSFSQANFWLCRRVQWSGYTLKSNQRGYLTLGWGSVPLVSVSAWK